MTHMQRIGLLVDEWPALGTDSTTQFNYLLASKLQELGHSVFVLKPGDDEESTPTAEQRRMHLERFPSVKTIALEGTTSREGKKFAWLPWALQWRRQRWYWQMNFVRSLSQAVDDFEIDQIFCYGDTGLAWLASTVPIDRRRVLLGDPPHMPFVYRQHPPFQGHARFLSPIWWLRWILIFRLLIDFRQLTRRLVRMECVSALYAKRIQASGLAATYFRSAVVAGEPAAKPPVTDPSLNLLVLGNAATTANRQGLGVLARHIAPGLKRELLDKSIRIRVVGASLPSLLDSDRNQLRQLGVELVGYVDDIETEYAWSHALLLPTTIPLGVRIRVIEGWSRGIPAIGHVSVSEGLPEAQDRVNCLLCASTAQFVDSILALKERPQRLIALSQGALGTYGEHFERRIDDISQSLSNFGND